MTREKKLSHCLIMDQNRSMAAAEALPAMSGAVGVAAKSFRMNLRRRFIAFIVAACICSCTNNPVIQKVKESSPLLHCEKVFADNSDAIDERNEIILQTGAIDTTDEHPPVRAAILTIDNKEVILNLKNQVHQKDTSIEIYIGGGYTLTISYKEQKNENGTSTFIGNFVLENNEYKKEYSIEGRNCNL